MFFKKKARRSFVDDEEILLEYLSSLNMEANNKIMLGPNRYKQINGLEAKRLVQTLCLLRDKGYVSLYFYGSEDEEHACDVTMSERALTYFEDQKDTDNAIVDQRQHDYKVAAFGAALGAVITLILTQAFK